MRVLISGAGIAGPTLAFWLNHYGFETTIVEKAPKLRTGGYVIDFWGSGFEVAAKMGLLDAIRSKGYLVDEIRVVGHTGRRIAGFPAAAVARVMGGRYVSIPRGDLAAAIFSRINGSVETIFGDTIAGMTETRDGVRVAFANGAERDFDLVVGTDALHSRVSELAFGPESRYEKFLGYKAAAFRIDGYRPRDELVYVMYAKVGRQIARFSLRDDHTMFLCTFADSEPDYGDAHAQKDLLRRRFSACGWECPAILNALDNVQDFYFDRISQIRMDTWSRGRVALVGDAAHCVSLLAGQGSALAMAGAYVLAGELHRFGGDYRAAFERYHQLIGRLLRSKQRAATYFAGAFAPNSRFAWWVRNRLFNLLRIGFIADFAVGRDLADGITLPEY